MDCAGTVGLSKQMGGLFVRALGHMAMKRCNRQRDYMLTTGTFLAPITKWTVIEEDFRSCEWIMFTFGTLGM